MPSCIPPGIPSSRRRVNKLLYVLTNLVDARLDRDINPARIHMLNARVIDSIKVATEKLSPYAPRSFLKWIGYRCTWAINTFLVSWGDAGLSCNNCKCPTMYPVFCDRCERGKRARYCGRECQKEHWKATHKHQCGRSS